MDVFEADQIRLRRSQQAQTRSYSDDPTMPSWALDLALLAFGGATLWMVTRYFRFDDPRPEKNAWSYFILIPSAVVVIDLIMRSFVSRFIERAIQSAFLFSVMLHLLMTFGAVNLVLFSKNSPELSAAMKSTTDMQSLVRPSERPRAPEYFESKDFEMDSKDESQQRPEYMQPAKTDDSSAQESETAKQEIAHETDIAAVEAPQPEASRPQTPEINRIQSDLDQPEIQSEAQELARSSETLERDSSQKNAMQNAPVIVPEGNTLDEQANDEASELANTASLPSQIERASVSKSSSSLSMLSESSFDIPLTDSTNATFVRPERTLRDSNRRSSSVASPSDNDLIALADRMNVSDSATVLPRSTPIPSIAINASPSKIALPEGDPKLQYGDGQASQDPRDLISSDQSRGEIRRSSDSANALSKKSSSSTAQVPSALNEPTLGATSNDLKRRSTASLERKTSQFRDLEPEIGSVTMSIPSRFPKSSSARMAPSTSTVPIPAPAFQQRMARNEGNSDAEQGDFGPETELAIERGLQFLSRSQRKDGSWHLEDFGDSPRLKSHTAATGLSLLAFQGAGYSHRQYQYADVCKTALEYLIANQKTNGDLYIPMDEASDANVRFYSHSIAALALCEAYGMTQDAALRGPAQAAVDFMVRSQDPVGGGWRYQPGFESDTSVSGWFMMALKSAELSGLTVPPATFKNIEAWLDKAQSSPEQRYLYRYNPLAPDEPATRRGRQVNPTMTGVGLLMRLYLGWRRDNEDMGRGADYLLQNPPSVGTAANPLRDTYYWYYATQVLFHMGGERWRKWNSMLHPLLIKSQQTGGAESGSWNPGGAIPDRWGPFAGRLYVTTLNLLSLEVYYRHLPIYEDTAR